MTSPQPTSPSDLQQIREAGLWRETQTLSSVGLPSIDFCSNDYLGLAKSSELRDSLISFLSKGLPLSSSSSRLIPGHHDLHEKAEDELSRFFGSEAGLLFGSGYSANVGLLATICKNALVLSDELNHASLIDGIRLSGAQKKIFRHNDMGQLESLLSRENSNRPIVIVTESVFSMDGDLAPLAKLQELTDRHSATLVVDEAHGSGIFGPGGSGRIQELCLNRENIISIHTFGKAFGSYGAFVAGSKNLRDLLVNKCREFTYTTALPPQSVWQIQESIRLVSAQPEKREKLFQNMERLSTKLGIKALSPIVPVVLGSNSHVIETRKKLRQIGIQVSAIRYPTVAKGAERLRICIHADHTFDQIDQLANILKKVDFAEPLLETEVVK